MEHHELIFDFCVDVISEIFLKNKELEFNKKIDALNFVEQIFLVLGKTSKYNKLNEFINLITHAELDLSLTKKMNNQNLLYFRIVNKIYSTIIDSLTLTYNLNYGFGDFFLLWLCS